MEHELTTLGLEHEVAYPKDNDYHGHPNYLKVYLSLLALFSISLMTGFIDNALLTMVLILGVAVCKTALVATKFMHLKWEPLLIWVAVGVVVFILSIFYFGVYPDIPMVEIDIAKP